ncbi:MAG: YvcK family protein [Eggerthellaceae bacterium]|nr:YvcK family protein [Eggerthellaceae bacterium]
MKDEAFRQDPAATAAFRRLNASQALPTSGEYDALRAVVIGGGTGAPMSIRTLLSMGISTDAIVAMADNGGSTGELRERAGSLAPGDIRKCLVAMADDHDDPLTRAFKYRFSFAKDHVLGNLMLAALEDATGSFPQAVAICEEMLGAKGHVYPSTLSKIDLVAYTQSGIKIEGQAQACHAHEALREIELRITDQRQEIVAYKPALEAIASAHMIVLGPGSLFTSVLPNLIIDGMVDAIKASPAIVVYVCSLADEQGETQGMSALEHYEVLERSGLAGNIHYMLVHSPEPLSSENPKQSSAPVNISYNDAIEIQRRGTVVLVRNFSDDTLKTWHKPEALMKAFSDIIRTEQKRFEHVYQP